MIIVSVHVLYVGFMPVLRLFTSDRTGCQVLKFASVYIGWQGLGARQLEVFYQLFRVMRSFVHDKLWLVSSCLLQLW